MRFYGWTSDQLYEALARVNQRYAGNLCFGNRSERNVSYLKREGKALSFTLRVQDSHAHGARTSSRGRAMPCASWHAHFDFMVECFAIIPTGRIKTQLADYRGYADFMEKYEATGNKVVGHATNDHYSPDFNREVKFKETTR